nr:NACHT, LRR and PYD domains-containing protein 3-like isoform X2 [Hydra vulgaris]XP_047131646.1 NACHT, LRR and PYD domains-containing protein 3-like isoform X2 [Hydra vulgaris]XP_047131647.1 NACHT, LRR and PYD domains-containing protein 3-like isoform X2 [Hydra vulgaris]
MENGLFSSLVKTEVSRNELASDEFISKCCGEISYNIGSDWLRWGRHLGLSDSDLDNIDSDNTKCYEKADNIFKKWKQKIGNPSWEQLKKELMAFNRLDIVIKIETKFGEISSSPNKDFTVFSNKDSSNTPDIASKIYVKKDISEICAALKNYYLVNYGKINEVQPLLKTPANVDLINTFVDLCIVDAVNTQLDFVFSVERKKFLEKQKSYTPIPYSEIFMKEKSVILISGIAGIGKTWLLRKCLLDWSNNLIWKNVELVFYLECRRLNQHQNISNINDLLNVFYNDILNDFNISNHTALFIIDGLDEFLYFNELLNPSFNYPVVNTLTDIKKYKHVIAGRVYAIDQYQSKYTEHSDKSIIQIMGFNENGINNYIENHVKEEKKEVIKTTLKDSPIAKAMASVPFYLSSMCKIISDSNKIYTNSFLTMTDLYANIFLYFLQKHIMKNDKLIYEIMEDSFNKRYILNICKIAYELFIKNNIIFSKKDIEYFISDFDQNDGNLFGFIEKVETNVGCYYQFAHLTIMEFCVSVYAYNCLSRKKIMANEKLRSCLSMICGLTNNKSQNSLLKFLVNLNPSNESLPWFSIFGSLFSGYRTIGCTGIIWILDRLSKSDYRKDYDLFIECFYESQSSFDDEIKSIVDKRDKWSILIYDEKTSYFTSCENYFINHYVKSGRKLSGLLVNKNILSDEEKKLLIQCSTNVCNVYFLRPINFEGWKPKDKIEMLRLWISKYLITKKDFEENFLPWINLCKELYLSLHYDVDFDKEFYEWIRCSNVKEFEIEYRGKYFDNLDELKNFTTR